jgi:uncharacterized protein YdbL (DUF1318 family)
MTRRELTTTFATFALATQVFAASCVTINVYFPEAAIQDLAERIEDQVERQAAATGEDGALLSTDEEDRATASVTASVTAPVTASVTVAGPLIRAWSRVAGPLLTLTAPTALAQSSANKVAAPEVTNPAIRAIIASRAKRLAALNRFKQQKVIGENNQGLVEARDLTKLALRDRATVQRLIKAENADREALYRELAAVKNVALSQLARIRETYAKTLREKAKSGDPIQQPDGRWTEKSS